MLLGESFILNAQIKQSAVDVLEVTIIGSKPSKFNTTKTGATTNISNDEIMAMPTLNRSVEDIARISPFANGMGFAGGDGRMTNFTVDGANFNNNFGLSDNLPGGGNPISLDAIQEIQVVVAPFDVRQTNFIGGGINAITKSGTNTFKGSAYTYYTNQNMRGNKIGDVDFGDRDKESTQVYGVTLGGPIIKNKLFFFVNGEYELKPGQVVTWRPSENGVADPDQMISRTSVSDMELVKQHLIDNYGYDPGSFTDYPANESNRKLLARIDWNINDDNKLSVRYNYTKNMAWNPTNGNSNNAGYRNRSMDRISQYSMAFSNSLYSMDNIVNSFSVDLNSKFSDKLSNQLLATFSSLNDIRGSNSEKFPFIDIMYDDDQDASTPYPVEPYISAGYELFTWNNGVHNNIWNITDNLIYSLDNHKITAGLKFEHQMANNSYMRNGTGYYRYANLQDFLNQAAPRDFALTYGYDGEQNPAAEVAFNTFGIYAQDEWNISSDFKLMYGLRADYLKYVDNVLTNNAILALDFGGKHIDTGKWPDGNVQWSPRVGFTWDVTGDQTIKLRGGTGMFAGRLPLVFFTNMPTNSGMVQGSYQAVTRYDADWAITSVDPALATLAGPMITNVDEMISHLGLPNTITPDEGVLPGEINAIASDFKMPQVWKTSLAVDYEIPVSFPMSVTLEGIFRKNINGVLLENYNLMPPDDTWEHFSGSDDRYIYPDDIAYTSRNAYVLSNSSEGWGAVGNITLTTEPVRNLKIMAAFTKTESKEVSDMPGSAAYSAYNGAIQVNGPHIPWVQRSENVVPSKAIASVSYFIPYANDHMSTSFNLFYSGESYWYNSFMYTNDMNGDGYGNDLIYIPSGRGDIQFVSGADEDAFFAFVEQDKYLSKHQGEYAEANAARSPWVHIFDLRVAQNFSINAGNTKHTLQLSLDIQNLGNLLNSKWGVGKYDPNDGRILTYEGVDANNVPSFSMATDSDGNYLTETYTTYYSYYQCWYIQIGARYMF